MNNKYKIILFVILLIILGIIVLVFENKQGKQSEDNSQATLSDKVVDAPQANTTNTSTNPQNEIASTSTSAMQSTKQLFSQSPDYAKAYLIYPTANAAAKKALAGFNLTIKDLGNGTTQVSLPTKTQTDEVQSFVVSKGQKVYFVEKTMRDDSLDTDTYLGDDYGVAVDANGFILQ